jgi:hypothetical protein
MDTIAIEAYEITKKVINHRFYSGKLPAFLREDCYDDLVHEAYTCLVLPNLKKYDKDRGKLTTFLYSVLSGRPLYLVGKRIFNRGVIGIEDGEHTQFRATAMYDFLEDEEEMNDETKYENTPYGLEIPGEEGAIEQQFNYITERLDYLPAALREEVLAFVAKIPHLTEKQNRSQRTNIISKCRRWIERAKNT